MKSILIALGLLIAACAPASAWDKKDMNAAIDSTNFLMNDNCSATLIDKDKGYLLTAAHCVQSMYKIVEREKVDSDGVVTTEKVKVAVDGTVSQITFADANETQRAVYTFKIVLSDNDSDLALVKVKSGKMANARQAMISCKAVERGDRVFAVGNPYAVLYSTVTDGIVASTDRNYKMLGITDQGDHAITQHTASIWGGNSGGALYNDKGEFVGVNVRGRDTLGISVTLDDVKKLLRREGLEAALWGDRCK